MIKQTLDNYTYTLAVEELKIRNNNERDPLSLSKNSLYYVQIIYFNPGCTITQISELIGVSKSAVTMKIAKLEKDGLIYKEPSKHDKRINYIYCSEALKADFKQLDAIKHNIYQKIYENHSPEEISTFCNILDEISASILHINSRAYDLTRKGVKANA